MTLKEALETGLPLARANSLSHRGSNNDGFVTPDFIIQGIIRPLTKEDICATDWVVMAKLSPPHILDCGTENLEDLAIKTFAQPYKKR